MNRGVPVAQTEDLGPQLGTETLLSSLRSLGAPRGGSLFQPHKEGKLSMHKLIRLLGESKRMAVVGLICGAFLGIASVALAAQATSATGYTPVVDGHEYATDSVMYTQQSGSPSDWAYTQLWTTGGENVGAGWMGADARKFKNGSVCESTGYEYNSSPFSIQGAMAASTACGSGTYYSYGVIAVWNGSGYNYYYSQQSPSLNG